MIDADFKETIIDERKKAIIIPATFNIAQVGNVKALSVILLGKFGLVKLYFYSIENEFDNDLSAFNSIIKSHQFSQGYQADEMGSIKLYERQPFSAVLLKIAVGAIIGVGAYWLITINRKK